MKFYLKDITENVQISGDEFKHIVKVLRKNVGDELCLFNGDGFNYFAKITNILKDSLLAKVTKKEKNLQEPTKNITLFLSLLKGEKMELVVQKISELGASNLVLFESKNADRKQGNLNFERLNKIAISATKQCGRSSVLNISESNLDEIVKRFKDFDLVLVAHEKVKDLTIKKVLHSLDETKINSVAIVVGPEGGLDETETMKMEQFGGVCVSLGGLIQRAETACISTTSIVACKFML